MHRPFQPFPSPSGAMRIRTLLPLLLLLVLAPSLRAQHRADALPGRLEPPALSAALPFAPQDPGEGWPRLRDVHYVGMYVGGTFGSALGILGGLLGTLPVAIHQGCIDCGVPDAPVYILMGAGSTLGTALGVTAVADEPPAGPVIPRALRLARSPVFRPALLGALAGVATGGGLALLVDSVAPSDQPYAVVAYNLGQAAASVLAVRLADPLR